MQSHRDASGLNEDVWSIILSFVQLDDARSLSLTSRAIHPIARCIVLSRAETSRPGHFRKICTFMLGDSRSRASWLRELDVTYYALVDPSRFTSKPLCEQLADLLGAARNLRILHLTSVDDLLAVEPRIGDALISLEGLKHINFRNISSGTLYVAEQMRSRPTTVALSFGSGTSLLDNLVTLSHLDLLRDVHTVGLYSLPEPSRDWDLAVEHFALGQLGQLPAVREARLRMCEPLPLFHVFPNMQTLRADAELSPLTPQKWMWPASVPLVDVTISFEDLVHFTRAPIRRLYLEEYSSCDHTLDQLASTLQSARPICLSFAFYGEGRMENDPLRNWAGVFQTILCSQGHLRYLEATFDCTYVYGANSSSPWMAEWFLPVIAQSNGDSSLLCMRLNFTVTVNCRTHARVPSLRLLHSTIQSSAQRVARHVPSVQYICIAMEPDFPEDQHLEVRTWWRVCMDAGQQRVESITNEAGERVEHYMRSADFERKLSLDGFILTGA